MSRPASNHRDQWQAFYERWNPLPEPARTEEWEKLTADQKAALQAIIAQQAQTRPKNYRRLALGAAGCGCAGLIILMIGIGIGSGPSPDTDGQSKSGAGEGSSDKGRQTPSESALPTVSAVQLSRAYDSNEVAADRRYKDHDFRISGHVSAVGKDITDSMYVELQGGADFRNVQCFFDDDAEEALAALSPGMYVTLQGRVEGLMVNVMVHDCKMVSNRD